MLIICGAIAAFILLLLLYLLSTRRTCRIRGKHVLITGGSSGIGKALAAEAIRRKAAAVTLLARNQDKLQAAKEELEKLFHKDLDQKVHVVSADISAVAVKDAVEEAVRTNGHVDVLVNCAGITHTATLQDTLPEKYKEILQVNLLGSVYTTQALLPAMITKKEGKIVFISSQAGQLGLYGYTAYSASKYALRGLAETLQMEVAPYNIGVSISFPPDTDTPQLQAELGERSAIETELASFGAVFQAPSIARDVWNGVEVGKFQITHGFDGFMLGVVNAGMSPVTHLWDVVTQAALMGVFRAVSLVYLWMFYRVVRRGLSQASDKKSQ